MSTRSKEALSGAVNVIRTYVDHASLANSEEYVQQLRRKAKEGLEETFVLSGKVLGKVAFPLRRYIRNIAEGTYVDIDELSRQRLREISQKGDPIILASNHRSVDPELYPNSHYRSAMSVDSFILSHVLEGYGIPLHILAQYNRYWHHPILWRRIKVRVGDWVREGLYEELGYVPVHTSHKHEVRPEGTIDVPYATYPIRVAKQIQNLVNEGHSLGFFLYYGIDDDTKVPDKLRPGAVYYGGQLGLDVVPAFILNAKHMDPRRTMPPDHVVLRIGEPMKIDPLSKDKRRRSQQMTEGLDELKERLLSLRRDAFAAQSK